MRVIVSAAAALALCACNAPQAAKPPACVASAQARWDAGGAGALQIAVTAAGPDCANAEVKLTISNAGGATLYTETFDSEQVMTLADATRPSDLQVKLRAWIDVAPTTTDTLPDWPEDAEAPMAGEFPFYPDEGVTRADYLAARAAHAPMFCYVQGMESEACIVLRDGAIKRLGAQTFPG